MVVAVEPAKNVGSERASVPDETDPKDKIGTARELRRIEYDEDPSEVLPNAPEPTYEPEPEPEKRTADG